jgi:NAD(P)-dependent dehydrogenase (short-subunit alcohol dehydrogenase family)
MGAAPAPFTHPPARRCAPSRTVPRIAQRSGIVMKIGGSVVIVTGASSGIGRALARRFAEEGAAVVLAARSAEKLAALAQELRERGDEALAVATDVTERDQVHRLVATTCERYGRLDILVNNAGRGTAGHVWDAPAAHYRALFELNVLGALHAMQAAIPRMRAQGGGVVVNISSGAGRLAVPGLSAYGASKAALDLISNTARRELGRDNIRVVTVYPPNTESDAAANMLGDPAAVLPLLLEAIATAVKPEKMMPAPAEGVAREIIDAIGKEPLPADLFLDRDMYVETPRHAFGTPVAAPSFDGGR